MTKRVIISLIFALSLGVNLFAQGEDFSQEKTKGWKHLTVKVGTNSILLKRKLLKPNSQK
jgi:hypothetical protein